MRWRGGLSAALAAWALWAGCQQLEGARQEFVADHRGEAQGRVGVLRGLEVHQSASQRAKALASRGDEPCGALPDRFSAHTTISATLRDGAGNVLASMREERDVSLDADHNAQLVQRVELRDPSGREGSWRREERVVGEEHFVQEENLPFSRRRARSGSRAEVLQRAMEPIPSALWSVGEGWVAKEGLGAFEAHATTGGRTLRCGVNPKDEPWIARLRQVAQLERASALLGAQERRFVGRWVGGGPGSGWSLDLDISEQIQHGPGPQLEAPAVGPPIERDRPYQDIQTILGDRLGLSQGRTP